MAALMTSVMGNTSKVVQYIQDCKKQGIEVLPPSINKSEAKFTVEGEGIRFALGAVKNVGIGMINSLVNTRQISGDFTNFLDFCQRVESKDINKRAVESLIKCGSFDAMGANRAQLLSSYETIMDSIQQEKRRKIDGQIDLFQINEEIDVSINQINLPNIKEFNEKIRLSMEKEVVGIYISGHPLSEFEKELENIVTVNSYELSQAMDNLEDSTLKDGQSIVVGGMITEVNTKITRNNQLMAFIVLEDLFGTIECIVFPKTFKYYNNLVHEESIVFLEGTLSIKEEEQPKILVNTINPLVKVSETNLKDLGKKNGNKLFIKIRYKKDWHLIEAIKPTLRRYKGDVPIIIYIEESNERLQSDRGLWVDLNEDIMNELVSFFGKENIKVV
ncbi:helix-hairpin-helix domain-containing protein [Alkaliphilus sp. B6464]|uniref:helix-hairpin-helix domain-containing protein n=1 Tax=Alkaliphilus sp. B6464 TaxID=2731219 RepID=UPI001BA6680F|nr:OB-fold nucleic acid binding domain-containing protein [Alkaliphilus sp. B6464]QUH18710.1 hypothetical protein HYG84_01485 [Alkaliphilus sp. B6464]